VWIHRVRITNQSGAPQFQSARCIHNPGRELKTFLRQMIELLFQKEMLCTRFSEHSDSILVENIKE